MYFQCPLTPHFGLIMELGYHLGETETQPCVIILSIILEPGIVLVWVWVVSGLELVTEQQEKFNQQFNMRSLTNIVKCGVILDRKCQRKAWLNTCYLNGNISDLVKKQKICQKMFERNLSYFDVCSYFRMQELLQALSPAEPHLSMSRQQELPDWPAPQEPVSALQTQEVFQDGHEARRWVETRGLTPWQLAAKLKITFFGRALDLMSSSMHKKQFAWF